MANFGKESIETALIIEATYDFWNFLEELWLCWFLIFLNIPRNIILVNLGKVGSYSDIASSGSIIRFFLPIYPVAGKLATGYGYINIWIYGYI